LVEVLVALAIVGLALGATAGVFRNGAASHAVAADVDMALAVAEERLTLAAVAAPLRPGDSHGDFGERFAWQTTVAPYDDGPADPTAALRLYRIEVAVEWREGRHDRRLSLSSLRLAPAVP
jgi:general secretion pathway protein I